MGVTSCAWHLLDVTDFSYQKMEPNAHCSKKDAKERLTVLHDGIITKRKTVQVLLNVYKHEINKGFELDIQEYVYKMF